MPTEQNCGEATIEVFKSKRDGITTKQYGELKSELLASKTISYGLKQRIAADDGRDPLDALRDAEMMLMLQTIRVDGILKQGQRAAPALAREDGQNLRQQSYCAEAEGRLD